MADDVSVRSCVPESTIASGDAAIIALTASDPLDLSEPLFRCFDHLLDASQDVRVEDRS